MKVKLPHLFHLKVLVFCCLIAITGVVLRPVQSGLGRVMQNVRDDFIENIEESTGLGIRYGSIRPYFFGSFEIRNIRFYKDNRSFFSVSRASVRFSLLKLIAKDKTAIHTVFIEKPVLRMDLKRDSDLFNSFLVNRQLEESEKTESEKVILQHIAEFLPKNVNYKIRDGSFLFINNDFAYQFDGMNIDILGDKSNILLDSAFSAEIRYYGFTDKTIVINANIDIKSMGDAGLQSLKSDILFSSISCSEQKIIKGYTSFLNPISTMERTSLTTLFTMHPFNISLSYEDRIIYIDQMPGNSTIDYSFRYNLRSDIMTAHLNMDNYHAGINFSFKDSMYKADHLLEIPITGNLWFLKNETGTLNYNVNYTAGNSSDGFILDAQGTNTNLKINNFSVYASEKTVKAGLIQGELIVKGDVELQPLRPNLDLSIKNFSLTGKECLNASLFLTSQENQIKLLGRHLLFSDVGIDELNIDIILLEDNIDIFASVICQDSGQASIDAVLSRMPSQFDAIINFESFSLYNFAGILRPFVDFISFPGFAAGFFKNNKIDSEIYFSSDFKNIIYHAPNIAVYNKNLLAEMSISGTDKQFNLNHGIIYFEEETLLISADAIVNNHMDISFNGNASYQDVTWNIEGQILDGTTLILRDPNGFHAYGNVNNLGEISGYIEGIDYPIPVNSRLLYLNYYITLRYSSREFWSLDVSYFEAKDVNSSTGESALIISGSADQDGASFREIIFNDNIGTLLGNADFAWDTDFSYLQFYVNMTDGHQDGEDYSIEGMLRNDHISINSDISNMYLNRFIRDSGTMVVSADINIDYDSISLFKADINVSSFYSQIRDNTLQASGGIILTNNDIVVQQIKVEFADIIAELPLVQISRAEGSAEFKTHITGLVQDKDFELQAEFNAVFANMDTWLSFAQASKYYEGVLYVNKFHYGDFLHNDVDFFISGIDGSVSLLGGVDDMLRLEMDNLGNFYMGLSAPLPIRGSIAGTLNRDFMLDAHCNYFFIDLKTIWDLASKKDNVFYFDSGYITGKIDIRGPVWNPEFFGIAKGSSLNIKVPSFIAQDIKPVPFNVVAEGYEMTFGPVVTVCGTGGGMTTGWLRFEFWSPKNAGLDIKIRKSTPIPYKIDLAGITSSGDVSGDFNLNYYDADKLVEIDGDLFLNNSEMGLNIGEFSINSESFNNSQNHSVVNIKITTGPTVEFFWPNKNNPMIWVTPEMGTVFYLSTDTQAQQYSLESEINIRTGELTYLDRKFLIKQGILYLDEDEREFNPLISVRAEIRDRVDSGPVTISMIVENQPLLSFEPRFESNPSLSQLELYSLLGHNYNIEDPESSEGFQRFLVSSTADLFAQVVARNDTLGQIIFLRQFERQARDILNLDMLSIRTKFLQNAIVTGFNDLNSRNNSVADSETINRTSRVGNYLDNTSVSIGKYIGPDMFIQGTIVMKQDEYNTHIGGVRFEPDIGIEWETPFVNIRWNFLPANPQNWWVNDNSITLTWSRSF